MTWNSLLGIFWVILFFGGSIFVHELGHYLAAKKRGLWVPRFSIGFGPRLFSWKHKGTEFCLSLIPLGGYVTLPQLADMSEIEGEFGTPPPNFSRPLNFLDKVIVSVMGAVFNLLFALVLATILWFIGRPVASAERTDKIGGIPSYYFVDQKKTPNPLIESDLRSGDRILSVDGNTFKNFGALPNLIAMGTRHDSEGNPISTLEIQRQKEHFFVEVPVEMISLHRDMNDAIRSLAILPAQATVVSEIIPHSPADQTELRAGDEILAINGERLYSPLMIQELLHNNDRVRLTVQRNRQLFFQEIVPVTQRLRKPYVEAKGTEGQLVLFAEGKTPERYLLIYGDELTNQEWTREEILTAFEDVIFYPEETRSVLGLQFATPYETVHENPFEVLSESIQSSYKTLGSLLNRHSEIGVQHLMGMPGIARTLHTLSTTNFRMLLWFVMILNIGLAIINLLPIPALDGGQILFAILEKILHRPLPPRIVNALQFIFIILLFGLMIYVSIFDIRRWYADAHQSEEWKARQSLVVEPQF